MRSFKFEVLGMGMNNTGYPGGFTEPVRRIISSVVSGAILHLYSGSSLLGNERIDLTHPNATRNCTVGDFISEDNRDWDWCILDPPYAIHKGKKLEAYGESDSLSATLSANVAWRRSMKDYFRAHIANILWLDYCAPMVSCFHREKLWLLLPGGFHTVRVLSWLKKDMGLLL